MAHFNANRQARLRELLFEQKRRMWNELRDELFRTTEELNTQFDFPQDLGDRGTIDFLEDVQLSVTDIRRQQLTRLDEAIAKFERGTYGICEKCGAEITENRLTAMPFAVYCLNCQRESEAPVYPPKATL